MLISVRIFTWKGIFQKRTLKISTVCKHKYFTTNIIKRCIKNSAAAYHQNAELNTDCV